MTDEEAQRIRTERLAQLGGLLAGFTHEIRNPLSTIGLNLQLVQEDFADAETTRDKRTYKRLTIIKEEVRRLQSILDDFLSFVRRSAPVLRDVDINSMLQGLVDFSRPEVAADGATLRFFPSSEVGTVCIDADLIKAVFVNLLRNARQACQAGDEILVSVRPAADDVIVQVTDTGTGMDPEVLERVFEPYFSTKKGGTGLGLSTAQRIIEEHGGRLEVRSEPGRGTQFTVRLPRGAPPAASGAGDDA